MTFEEDLKRMKELASYNMADEVEGQTGDEENWHQEADAILIKYVPKELAEAWEQVGRWYS